MFEGHVRFERIFGKNSEHVKAAKLLYQSLPLHHSPGFWLVVPGKRRLASSGDCITLTVGDHHPRIQEQGRVLVVQQPFGQLSCFFLKKILLLRYFYKNVNEILAPARELGFFNRLKILLQPRFAKMSFKVFFDFRRF